MRVFLAATTSGMPAGLRDDTIKKCRPLYILETFYSGERACLKAMGDVGADNFLLDSGAYSYMNGADVTLEAMQAYVERYIQFIIKNNIRYFFEIDVDNIFGLDMVEYWRGLIEKRTGRQCIPVWHKGRGVGYWERMCAGYGYVAIGGLVSHVRKQEYEGIKKLISYANDRGVKVHGLGFTKTRTLHEYGWYSVDSSTWNIGAARGQQIYSFRKGIMHQRKIDKDGRRVDIARLMAHNMVEWTRYQRFMEGIRV